jgi:glyoxylase-like metal-dependent hydrolase (beta-lactamase superfamily II)
MKRRYKIALVVLLLVGIPYYWRLVDNRPGPGPGNRFDLAELRRLADAVPGPKPTAVAIQTVGWTRVPGTLFVAGGGLKRKLISIQAALIRGPWGDVAVDSGFGRQDAEAFGLEKYFPANQRRVDAALRNARLIVFTHEHLDHMGGLLRLRDFSAVAPKALITPEQRGGNRWSDTLPWPKGTALEPFRYQRYAAVAPGVVLIRTPGHTPGSQMVFVRLADGREYLLAGDTATMTRSWTKLRARSRLIGDLLVGEDRAAVFAWLKAIRALHRADPGLIVVPGHEDEALRLARTPTGIAFAFPEPAAAAH